MALSSSNAVKQLSDANSQGTVLGQSTSDRIAFYGATPLTQQSGPLAASTATVSTVLATSASPASIAGYGVSSQAQMHAIITGVNALIVDVAALRGLYNGLRTSLTTTGLFSGS